MKGKHQYRNLDGLRGVAALSVVLLHYVTAFAPFLIGAFVTQHHTRFDSLISTTPLHLPFAGGFAVCIFFVLSGFVLSLSFFRYKNSDVLTSSAARRYFRLMFPAFGSIMLAYVVFRLGGTFTHEAANVGDSSVWLNVFWNFPAHIGQAVFQGLYGIWFGSFHVGTSYNVVLWTMHFELFGSFLIFLFLALFGKLPQRGVFYMVFMLIFLKTYYLAFIAGVAICDLVINKPERIDQLSNKLVWAFVPVGLILGSWTTSGIYKTFYSDVHLPFFLDSQVEIFAQILGAVFIVFAVLRLRPISRVLEARPFQYLGKISFSLYLTHFIVLSSLGCYVFYKLTPVYGYKVGVLATILIAMPVTFAVASLFTRLVDVPSISLSKKIGTRLLSPESLLPDFKKLLARIFGFFNELRIKLVAKYSPSAD